jgi:putative NIF3 family GTP cyclohydrolase 1 type 2
MTVQEYIDAIFKAYGGPLGEVELTFGDRKVKFQTSDTVKAGDTSQELNGAVTTFMATVPVIRRAVELGANLVLTHEPTYFNGAEDVNNLPDDPVVNAKKRLLEETGVVICRLHDHPHGLARTQGMGLGPQKDDPFFVGLVEDLGWLDYGQPDAPHLCTIPPLKLRDLVEHVKRSLGLAWVRVSGDLDQECRRVGVTVGASGLSLHMLGYQLFNADVVLTGECPEWETFYYAADACELGLPRAIIALGHEPSEEPGMRRIADWLRTEFPDVPVAHVPSKHFISAL